ncbi:hypothetical protein L1887_14719 [Cichorium endivia]|nr:hypothetical protein L1887_14719 [Cichorium endivia]
MSSKGIKRHSATASSSKRGSSKGNKSGEPKEPTLHFAGRTQKNKFKALQDREVKPTKFMHADSFQTLGVLGGVFALFQNIGWGLFLNLHAYTFETPTREFLSSFERNDNERRVTFRLQGVPLSLAYDDMNRIMGTPTENISTPTNPNFEDFDEDDFWFSISGKESYSSSRSKATDIIHPCIRLAHRILVCTIFAHKEVGQVGKWELYFLWCMTRAVPPIPDFASFFLQKCISVMNEPSGQICIGGLITILATSPPLSLIYTSPPYARAEGSTFLDLATLGRMNLIRPRGLGIFTWFHSPDRIPFLVLPDPRIAEFNPRISDSWIITRTIHEREEVLANHGGDDEPMQEAHAPQDFLPDFFTRFNALCLQTEQLHQRVGSIWDWHIQEGHFDYSPPNPPM